MATDKQFTELVSQAKSMCSAANSNYHSIDKEVTAEFSEIKRCKQDIKKQNDYISGKEASFSARKAEYQQAQRNAAHYRSLASQLRSEAYDAEDSSEARSMERRAQDADERAKGEDDLAQKALGEMAVIQQEINEAKGIIAELQSEIAQHERNLKEIAGKCTEIAGRLNRNGMVLQSRAAEINRTERAAFDRGGRTEYGSESRFAAGWCSNIAQEGHNYGVTLVKSAEKFRELARSAARSGSGDDSADNYKNSYREERTR